MTNPIDPACPPQTPDHPDPAYVDLLDGDDDDEWEDTAAFELFRAKMPSGWYMFKINNFDAAKLLEIDDWCAMNCRGAYKRVGWVSGCAYSVAMQLADSRDAVHFRLMWSS